MANIFQSSKFANLFNSIRSQVFRNGGVNVVSNRDSRLHGTEGTERALNVLRDIHVQACYSKLLEVMSGAYYTLEPGDDSSEAQEAADFIEKHYLKPHREVLIESLAVAIICGCAAHEVNFELNAQNKIIVASISAVDPMRLIYAINDYGKYDLRIQTSNRPFQGELPPKDKIVDFQYYSFQIDNAGYGMGYGSQLIDFIDYKEELLAQWLRIAERYATPVKIGTLPDTVEEEEIDDFFQHFSKMSENATFLLPEGFSLDVKDISSTGAESLLKTLIDYIDERISHLLLGQALTGRDLANGAHARDKIAAGITERKALSLLNGIAAKLNQTTIKTLTQLNFAGVEPPKVSFELPIDKSETIQLYLQAKQLGINLDLKRCAEILGVPTKEGKTPRLGDGAGEQFPLPQDLQF